jgi:prolyl-tRNA editing enzyme YbaK/EbsC (Cys-tRNA(Pro) deacylase)
VTEAAASEAELPAAVRRVQAALAAAGLETQVVMTGKTARTAEDAAAAVGVEVGQIVKSLVFLAGERPVLALVSGANRLDAAKLRAVCHGEVTRADADRVRAATGYAIGGIPPLGHATELPIYCDRDLLRYGVVWAAAGTPHAVFEVAPDALVRATGAVVADLAEAS